MLNIGVVGVGQLGLCFSLVLDDAGYNVIGVDVRSEYVDRLNTHSYDGAEPNVASLLAKTNARFTADVSELRDRDMIFVLVATPTSHDNLYDHTTLLQCLTDLRGIAMGGCHVVISCTILPGVFEAARSALARDDVTLSYNPSFVAQGEIVEAYQSGGQHGLVLLGCDDDGATDALLQMYTRITYNVNVRRLAPESAVLAKLFSNAYATMKISFCNMISDLAQLTPGADADDICAALATDAKIGPKCFRPGYGYGGPCFPRDNRAIVAYARQVGGCVDLCEASDTFNTYHHARMADAMLSKRNGNDPVEFRDVCYRSGMAVPLIDNSPKLHVARMIAQRGGRVVIRDRKVVIEKVKAAYGALFEYVIENTDATNAT